MPLSLERHEQKLFNLKSRIVDFIYITKLSLLLAVGGEARPLMWEEDALLNWPRQTPLHSLVRYPPLQKIIRETKLSYLGGLLLASIIKFLRLVYSTIGGAVL